MLVSKNKEKYIHWKSVGLACIQVPWFLQGEDEHELTLFSQLLFFNYHLVITLKIIIKYGIFKLIHRSIKSR